VTGFSSEPMSIDLCLESVGVFEHTIAAELQVNGGIVMRNMSSNLSRKHAC
jgi:hypothetical protein